MEKVCFYLFEAVDERRQEGRVRELHAAPRALYGGGKPAEALLAFRRSALQHRLHHSSGRHARGWATARKVVMKDQLQEESAL